MEQETQSRLNSVLTLLGYDPSQPRHHRYNLLSALRDFAALQGDAEMEAACEAALRGIQAE